MRMLLRTLVWGTLATATMIPSATDPSVGVWSLIEGSGSGEPPRKLVVREDGADGWIAVTAWFTSRVETLRMKRNGQDYPVRGALAYHSVSSIRLDSRMLEAVFRKDRREVRRCTWEFASGGESSKMHCTDRTAASYRREGGER